MGMSLITIRDISKDYNVSTRTLRYYEQIGLIESAKKDDYAYRTYDEANVLRLRQILVLRKLRIPLKQIALILESEDAAAIINAFEQNLAEVDDEITALSTIRDIIASFIARLNERIHPNITLNLLDDTALLEAVDALTAPRPAIKEDRTAEDLQSASEKLLKLTGRQVRIVYLPSMTVAAIHIVGQDANGEHAEYTSAAILDAFNKSTNLQTVYPAARSFGFNNPDAVPDDDPDHGYERWISIPDDMEVPAPLVKKRLEGGLYAAHVIPFGAWDEGWLPLHAWVADNNDRYVGRWSTIDGVCGWLEEHLNHWQWNDTYDGKVTNQVDLLMPVKPRFAASTGHPQEHIVETLNYNGVAVEVVEWRDTIWCGKIGYAENNTDEPNVEAIMSACMSQDCTAAHQRLETDWDVCISVNYLSKQRPNGVMFAFLVGTAQQPEAFDVYQLPAAQYLRIALDDDTAKAVASEPWNGGIPPYEWLGERIAPQFGYRMGNDDMAIFEYYGYYQPEKNAHEFRWLYVPVIKVSD